MGERIFGHGKPIDLDYQPAVDGILGQDPTDRQALEQAMRRAFERVLPGECRARRCLAGPQRDDLGLQLDGREAASQASAGEQRRLAFVLVMAALELALDGGRAVTVLLVDDVEAEFDDERLDRVFAFLQQQGAQALVATSKEAVLRRYGMDAQVIRVERGELGATDPGRKGAQS